MRAPAGFLFVLCAAAVTRALAGDPAPPQPSPTPSATTAPAPVAADSNSPKPAAVSAADAEKQKADTSATDKDLKSRGYKIQMRNGEKYFCRMEAPVGSHLEKKECYTAASIYAKEESSQEFVRRMQTNSPKISN